MLRNFAYGGLALIGGAITGIAISSWATPTNPPQVAPEIVRVASAAQPVALSSSSSRTAPATNDCSPWDVSDVAMEAALKEMIRRGWRPPSQAEIVASYDSYGSLVVQPVEPDSLVPVRRPVVATDTSDGSGEDFTFPVEQIQPTSDGPQTTPAPAVSPPAPPPASFLEEPMPRSN